MTFYTAFAEHYEAIFPFSEGVYAFLREHLPGPPARVLDVGCATGLYTGRLARDGYAATGVDLDAAMIAVARARYPLATFQVLDMTRIEDLDRVFGGTFCIGNTAAHLTRAQFSDFVGSVGATLRPGGPWMLQVMNWDYVLTQSSFTFPVIEGGDGVVFHREYRDISKDGVTFATRLVVHGVEVFEEAVVLTPMRSGEIVAMHEAAGFTLVAHVGSYGGKPFDPEVFSANVMVFERGDR